jgi:hypothetical protein
MRPRAPRPGAREGMTAASGTARTARPSPWDGPDSKLRYPAPPRLPFPAAPIIGLPPGHLKDASGAAPGGRAPPGP